MLLWISLNWLITSCQSFWLTLNHAKLMFARKIMALILHACVCVCVYNIYVCKNMDSCAFMRWRPEVAVGSLPLWFSNFTETAAFHWTWGSPGCVGQWATDILTHPAFYTGTEDLNLGLYAFTANTLLTQTPSSLGFLPFKFIVLFNVHMDSMI